MSPVLACVYLSQPEVLERLWERLSLPGRPDGGIRIVAESVDGKLVPAVLVKQVVTLLPVPDSLPCGVLKWAQDGHRIVILPGTPPPSTKLFLELSGVPHYWMGEGFYEWAANLKAAKVEGGL